MAFQEVLTRYGFEFDQSKFAAIERGVKRNVKNLNTVAQKTDQFRQRMGGFFQQAKGVIGAYLGFRAIRTITSDYAQAADQVAKFSSGLGINAQEYQKLTHAAQLNGISIEELNVALPNLAKRAGDAADGSKAIRKAFSDANTEFEKSPGKLKDPIQLMTDLADGLKTMGDENRKTQVLMNLFGRAGKKMGVLMAQGSEGIKKAMAEAEKLGIVLGDKQLKDAENFNDEMLRVKSIMTGIRNTIASRVLPVLNRQLRAFQMWWREGKNAERAMRSLKAIGIALTFVIGRMITGAVIKQVTLFVRGIWAGVQALRAMGVAGSIATLKVTALFAAIALIGLIIEDLIGFARGKDSVIGRLLGPSKLADDLREALIGIGKDAVKAWKDLKPALLDAWNALKPALRDIGKELRPLAGPAFRAAIMALIMGIKLTTFMINQLAASIRFATALFTLLLDGGRWAATEIKAVWEGTILAIEMLLDGLSKTAKTIGKALGIDLSGPAAGVKKAWDWALGGIIKTLDKVISGAKTALLWLGAVTGMTKQASSLAAGVKAAVGAGNQVNDITSQGTPVLPGLFRPTPATIFAGAGGANVSNANVGPGAVQVTINGVSGPAEVAAALNAQLPAAFAKIITDASRDLKPPPRGQT
jgi:hypothetical protein